MVSHEAAYYFYEHISKAWTAAFRACGDMVNKYQTETFHRWVDHSKPLRLSLSAIRLRCRESLRVCLSIETVFLTVKAWKETDSSDRCTGCFRIVRITIEDALKVRIQHHIGKVGYSHVLGWYFPNFVVDYTHGLIENGVVLLPCFAVSQQHIFCLCLGKVEVISIVPSV